MRMTLNNVEFTLSDFNKNGALFIAEPTPSFKHPFNNEYKATSWNTSSLREFLNEQYLNSLPKEICESIIPTPVAYTANPVWPRGRWNDVDTHNIRDKVFILSLEEMKQLVNLEDAFTRSENGVWLRNPGISDHAAMFYNYETNAYSTVGQAVSEELLVRPAFYLPTTFVMNNKEDYLL